MAASMEMVVFWVVAPFSLVEGYQCFKDLQNIDQLLADYTILQPRRQPSSA
jgi:hypothetical protein